ncbi:MAG: hypothetical protein U1D55_18280 [Phycisphaerae bacterium]
MPPGFLFRQSMALRRMRIAIALLAATVVLQTLSGAVTTGVFRWWSMQPGGQYWVRGAYRVHAVAGVATLIATAVAGILIADRGFARRNAAWLARTLRLTAILAATLVLAWSFIGAERVGQLAFLAQAALEVLLPVFLLAHVRVRSEPLAWSALLLVWAFFRRAAEVALNWISPLFHQPTGAVIDGHPLYIFSGPNWNWYWYMWWIQIDYGRDALFVLPAILALRVLVRRLDAAEREGAVQSMHQNPLASLPNGQA